MCNVKWLKVMVDMFDNIKFRIIDTLPERDVIIYVWMRLLCQAGKINEGGKLYLMPNVPFTLETLAAGLNRPLEAIKEAIKVLIEYQMIETDEDGFLWVNHWDEYQNVEGLERIKEQTRKRVSKYRQKHKDEICAEKITTIEEEVSEADLESEKETNNLTKNNSNVTQLFSNVTSLESNVTVTQQNKNKNKNKKEKEEEDKKREIREKLSVLENPSCQKAAKILSHYEKITGKMGILNFNALSLALNLYDEKYVRQAIDKAIALNKLNMPYINGILRNWAANGFKEGKVGNGRGEPIRKDTREFEGFKPQEARKLTKAERYDAERELI